MNTKKGRLLIVDDEPTILFFLKKLLRNTPHEILTALSGHEALDILNCEEIDILITDIRMPVMDGLELIKRARELRPHIQCMIISGYGDIETAMAARKLGAVNYFLKPMGDGSDIIRAINRSIEKTRLTDEMQKDEEIYQRLFSSISEAAIIMEVDSGRIIDVNEAALTVYGYSRDEFLALQQTDITTKPENIKGSINQSLTNHYAQIPLQHHRKKDGSIFPVEISATTFLYQDRQVLCWLTVDITASMQAEEQRLKEHDELEQRVKERTIELQRANQMLQVEIQERIDAQQLQEQSCRLLDAIDQIQLQYIETASPKELFNELLDNLLYLTRSEYGFIGEVLHNADGAPYLKAHAISDFSWNKETKDFYNKVASDDGLELRSLQNLFGRVIDTGRPVIDNTPANAHPGNSKMPANHPPINTFLGLPLLKGQETIGMAGIANRPTGYNDNLINYLEPFTKTCARLIAAYRNDQLRREAEKELERNYEIQTALNRLLKLSLEDHSLETILGHALEIILAIPWLKFKMESCIFVVEDDPQVLVMKAQQKFDERLRKTCSKIPFGKCLCGRAAATGEVQFTAGLNTHHEIINEGMPEHGHYCVPIRSAEAVIGVINMYLPAGHQRNDQEEQFLNAVANTLSNIIFRKQAEKALTKSEKKFRDLAENSLAGIMIVENGRITYHNPKIDWMFNPLPQTFNLEDLQGIHPDDLKKTSHEYQRLITGKQITLNLEFRYYPQENKKKEMCWIYCCAYLLDSGKDNTRILFNMVDITRSRELERMVAIQDKMSSLGRVATGIAHEIRNPLSTINVYLSALRNLMTEETCDSESLTGTNSIILEMEQASQRIESVVRRVMDFSKPTSHALKQTSINLCVQHACDLSAVTLRKAGITLLMELDDTLPDCFINSQLTEQVLLNLITNAAEALEGMDPPRQIKLKTFLKPDSNKEYIAITIDDSGPGVPLESRDKVFDPFYTTKKTGTGIGLSICQRMINDQHGTLSVSDSELGGARFNVEIPVEKRSEEK